MATWLVTGGCGFIGSHLVEALLARGDHVRVLDNLSTGKRENARGAELIVGDITDFKAVVDAVADVDGCFHLAAIASVELGRTDWLGTHRTNLTGTINLFEAVRRVRGEKTVPIIYASSAAVYGDCNALPISESERPSPLSAYGADKLGCELHAKVGWHVHGLPSVGLRFFNVFGPRQDASSPYSGVISVFGDRLRAGRGLDIFGDGGQTRDFIYVKDVVRGLLTAMGHREGAAIFNVCTGIGTSIRDLAMLMAKLYGRTPIIAHGPERVGDIRTSVGDPALAARALGFAAATTLSDGLKETVASLNDASRPDAEQLQERRHVR